MKPSPIKAREAVPGRHAIPQSAFGPAVVIRVEVVGPRTTITYRWGTVHRAFITPSESTLILIDLKAGTT